MPESELKIANEVAFVLQTDAHHDLLDAKKRGFEKAPGTAQAKPMQEPRGRKADLAAEYMSGVRRGEIDDLSQIREPELLLKMIVHELDKNCNSLIQEHPQETKMGAEHHRGTKGPGRGWRPDSGGKNPEHLGLGSCYGWMCSTERQKKR